MQFSTEIRSEDAALITLCIIMEESAIDVILFTAEFMSGYKVVLVVSFASSLLQFSSLVVLAALRGALRSTAIYTGLSAEHNRGTRRRRWWWRRGRGWGRCLATRWKVQRCTGSGARSWHGCWHGHGHGHWHRTGGRTGTWRRYRCATAVLHTSGCADLWARGGAKSWLGSGGRDN